MHTSAKFKGRAQKKQLKYPLHTYDFSPLPSVSEQVIAAVGVTTKHILQ